LLLTRFAPSLPLGQSPTASAFPASRHLQGSAPVPTSMASARVHPGQPPKTARRPLLATRRNPNAAAATPRTTGVRDVARQPVSGLGPATAQAPALAL